MHQSKTAVLLVLSILTGSVFAAPDACPGIAAIQAEGITLGYEVMAGFYAGMSSSHFDRSENWIFTIGPFNVESAEEAIVQGNQYLPLISGNPVPKEHGGVWYCLYQSGANEYQAMAFQADPPVSSVKFKSYFNKSV